MCNLLSVTNLTTFRQSSQNVSRAIRLDISDDTNFITNYRFFCTFISISKNKLFFKWRWNSNLANALVYDLSKKKSCISIVIVAVFIQRIRWVDRVWEFIYKTNFFDAIDIKKSGFWSILLRFFFRGEILLFNNSENEEKFRGNPESVSRHSRGLRRA